LQKQAKQCLYVPLNPLHGKGDTNKKYQFGVPVQMACTVPFIPALLDTHCIVDARTPLEFAEDHLPGAINVPILTNPERVEIGTLYRQQGPQTARKRGLELTCHRFPSIVAVIAEAAKGRPVLVYCWRGGLRSESIAMLLEMTGYPVVKLAGGYKAFRATVSTFFEAVSLPVQLVVLHGMTGSGKTEFLLQLPQDRYTVIDLEGLARHRGSAFGALGMGEQPPQKLFESLLWNAFRQAPVDRPIVVEGESKRIGRITLPGNLYEVMAESTKVWCLVSVPTRVKRLSAEYAKEEYRQPMAEALERIRKKLGGSQYEELHNKLAAWDIPGVAQDLIEQYYDKLYYRVRKWEPEGTISLEDYTVAERELAEICEN
jgi:tRNA 2-selenouridine synthase